MKITNLLKFAVPWVVSVAVVAGAVAGTRDVQRYRHRPYLEDNLYLPTGKFITTISLGYRQLVADMVWFQAVQYFGGYAKDEHDLRYFAGLIDIVSDLDPHFIFPYTFAGVVLSQEMSAPDEAVAVLKKGMAHNPTNWELPFEIGFLSYVDRRQHETAARYFELASRLPGGGDRARRFAAFVYSRAGHEENSLRMWEQLYEESEEPYMRELAKGYIERLRGQQNGEQRNDDDGI